MGDINLFFDSTLNKLKAHKQNERLLFKKSLGLRLRRANGLGTLSLS